MFYTREVNLLFKANELQLQHFFKKYADSEGKYITQARATYDILGEIFKIGTMKAQILYGRCKMSVANETGNFVAYQRLRYVELLELLCRVAFYVFK